MRASYYSSGVLSIHQGVGISDVLPSFSIQGSIGGLTGSQFFSFHGSIGGLTGSALCFVIVFQNAMQRRTQQRPRKNRVQMRA